MRAWVLSSADWIPADRSSIAEACEASVRLIRSSLLRQSLFDTGCTILDGAGVGCKDIADTGIAAGKRRIRYDWCDRQRIR